MFIQSIILKEERVENIAKREVKLLVFPNHSSQSIVEKGIEIILIASLSSRKLGCYLSFRMKNYISEGLGVITVHTLLSKAFLGRWPSGLLYYLGIVLGAIKYGQTFRGWAG